MAIGVHIQLVVFVETSIKTCPDESPQVEVVFVIAVPPTLKIT